MQSHIHVTSSFNTFLTGAMLSGKSKEKSNAKERMVGVCKVVTKWLQNGRKMATHKMATK